MTFGIGCEIPCIPLVVVWLTNSFCLVSDMALGSGLCQGQHPTGDQSARPVKHDGKQ